MVPSVPVAGRPVMLAGTTVLRQRHLRADMPLAAASPAPPGHAVVDATDAPPGMCQARAVVHQRGEVPPDGVERLDGRRAAVVVVLVPADGADRGGHADLAAPALVGEDQPDAHAVLGAVVHPEIDGLAADGEQLPGLDGER